MDSGGAFWLCVATFVVGSFIGGSFHRKENFVLEKSAHRYRVEREGVIKDSYTNTMYYSDSLVEAKPRQHKEWYFAENAVDREIIEKIMLCCHSSRDVEAVQDMIHIYGAKKKNIASLVDGRDGYEISTLYERCARNRYAIYGWLEVIDSLTVAYLKNGGEKLRADIMIDKIEMQIHPLKMFDDMRRVRKIYYSDAEE